MRDTDLVKEISSRRERVGTALKGRLKRLRIRPKRILPWVVVVLLFFAAGGGFWLYRTNRLREALPPQGALSVASAPQIEGMRDQLLFMEVMARLSSLEAEAAAKRDLSLLVVDYDVLYDDLEHLYGSSATWPELEGALDTLESELRDNDRAALSTLSELSRLLERSSV